MSNSFIRYLRVDQFSKFNYFLWVCWFLGKNLSDFIPPVWKLHNPYCHTAHCSLDLVLYCNWYWFFHPWKTAEQLKAPSIHMYIYISRSDTSIPYSIKAKSTWRLLDLHIVTNKYNYGLRTPNEAFFHWISENLGLGIQIGEINSVAFVVFSAILVQWVQP